VEDILPDPVSGAAVAKEGYGVLKELLPLIIKSWRYISRTRIPRATKGSVGFAIAIAVEKEAHRERLASDFIDTLRP
jgi:hypothetical protein